MINYRFDRSARKANLSLHPFTMFTAAYFIIIAEQDDHPVLL